MKDSGRGRGPFTSPSKLSRSWGGRGSMSSQGSRSIGSKGRGGGRSRRDGSAKHVVPVG